MAFLCILYSFFISDQRLLCPLVITGSRLILHASSRLSLDASFQLAVCGAGSEEAWPNVSCGVRGPECVKFQMR